MRRLQGHSREAEFVGFGLLPERWEWQSAVVDRGKVIAFPVPMKKRHLGGRCSSRLTFSFSNDSEAFYYFCYLTMWHIN